MSRYTKKHFFSKLRNCLFNFTNCIMKRIWLFGVLTIWEIYWLNPFVACRTCVFGGRTRKENQKLFWDLTGSPAGNYVRETSGGNWPNACIGNKSINKTDPLCICGVCILRRRRKYIRYPPDVLDVKGQQQKNVLICIHKWGLIFN